MITTQTNLRATATEAYDKGYAEGVTRRAAADIRDARVQGRREGEGAVQAFILEGLWVLIAQTEAAIEKAPTRWEKRLHVGRLEGLKLARKQAASA